MLIVITMFNIYVFCMLALRFGMSLTVTYFIKNDQKRLSTSNTSQSRSALACAFTCSLDSDCWSLSFNGVTGDCLLSDIKVKVIQDNWIEDVEWQTLSKTGKTFVCTPPYKSNIRFTTIVKVQIRNINGDKFLIIFNISIISYDKAIF